MSKTTIPAGGITDGTLTSAKLDQDGAFTFNEDSASVDFRVESNGDANCLIVDASGDKVGMGLAVPEGKLHIFTADASVGPNGDADELVIENGTSGAGVGISLLSATNGEGRVVFGDANDDNIGQIFYNHGDNTMRFITDGGERMRMDSDGHMGINFSSAHDNAIKVENFSDSEWVISMRHTDSDNPLGMQIYYSGGAPDGSGDKFIRCLDTGAERFHVLSDGDVGSHDNSFGGVSDQRIKQDITDASSQWDDIKAVKVRKFKMKDDVRQYGDDAWDLLGVVAQELEASNMDKLVKEIDPSSSDILSDSSFGTLYQDGDDLPKGREVGEVKTVNAKVKHVKYSILYMKAIKALQEAMTRIETLETKVKALEG